MSAEPRPEGPRLAALLTSSKKAPTPTSALRWYSPVPVAMLLDSSLSPQAKVLAGLLLWYNGPKGCFPKIETLEHDLNVARHTVMRGLEELERYGFLVRERIGRHNRYILRPVYERPIRPDSLEATGALSAQNSPRPKPPKRRTLHKTRAAPTLPLEKTEAYTTTQPMPQVDFVGRRRSHSKRRLVAPVQQIAGAHSLDEAEHVASVRHVDSHDSAGDREKVAPEQQIAARQSVETVAPVAPVLVASVPLEAPGTLHRSDLDINKNHTYIENHQHQTESGIDDAGDGDVKRKDRLRDAIAALQRVGVNVDARDLGIHLGRDRKLHNEELLAWAAWVTTTPAPSIANKPAFAASKIRMGCTLEDVFPAIAIQARGRERSVASVVAAAEAERTERESAARADALMANLPKDERARLREQALDDGAVWLARNASRSLLARMILATERRLVLRGLQPVTVSRDHSAYPELPPL